MVGFAMSEDNLERILAHPLGMVCSDGGAFAIGRPVAARQPAPARARHVPARARPLRARAESAHARAGGAEDDRTARVAHLELADRGRIAPKLAADIVVFDPATVTDKATFEEPFQYPEGIRAVIVNGQIAFRDGQRTKDAAGKALRPT